MQDTHIKWYEIVDKQTRTVRCLHCDSRWTGRIGSHQSDCPVRAAEYMFSSNMSIINELGRDRRKLSWWMKVAPAFFFTGFLAGVTAARWAPGWHLDLALGGALISAGFVLLLWRTIPD